MATNFMLDELYEEESDLIKTYTLAEFLSHDWCAGKNRIVDPLIRAGEFVLCTATAKTGKSWLAIDLAMSVASGQPFLGKFPTEKSGVLIVQTEVPVYSFQDRLIRFLGDSDPNEIDDLHISSAHIKLDEEDGFKKLEAKVQELAPQLVVLDPFYTFHTMNEDSASEMAPFLAKIRKLFSNYSCACFLIHHQGKPREGNSGQVGHKARGSSAFADVPDSTWSIERKDGECVIRFEMRNDASPDPIRIKLNADTGRFDVVGEYILPKNGSVSDLVELLTPIGSTRMELIGEYTNAFGLSKRTAESRISEAIKRGLIVKRTVNGESVYFPVTEKDRKSVTP